MEEVPATQLTEADVTDKDSQESLTDRVPESPPLYTQDNSQNSEDEQDDIEAQISKSSVSAKKDLQNAITLVYDNESPTRSSKEDERTHNRKASDVVIDMEEICENMEGDSQSNEYEIEEFPDEDDALLVSATENAEAEGAESLDPGDVDDQGIVLGPAFSVASELSDELKADDAKRKKLVDDFKRFKPLEKIFPDVRCSEHNTVTFTIKPNYTPGDLLEPNPPRCVYKWEPKFIPMPYCNENIIIVRSRVLPASTESMTENETDNKKESSQENPAAESSTADADEEKVFAPPRKIRVWQRIKESLMDEKILCSQDFVTVFKRYCRITSEFKALDYCIEQIMMPTERIHFFKKVVPFMASLVLSTAEIVTCPIPFLKKNLNYNISLSQKQVACLLANAFFCTFPRRFKSQMQTPSINFKELFTEEDERILLVKAQKIRCLIHYFTRIESDMPRGVVTYTRKNLRHSNMPDWGKIDKKLSKLVPLLQGTIEDDGAGMLKVDFANCNLGGGVLGRGAVQEEILFVIYPELILTRLFTEKLNFNEAVIITGCERFSKYQGYSLNFKFDGDYQDATPYDSKGRRCTQIVAIDALYISRPSFQYHPKHILRELNKAYVGFSSPISSPVAVATGKWGCGAFNGDPQLKTVIQLMAASHAGRDVALFTFEDVTCLDDILAICDYIKDLKIKDVWHLVCQYHSLCCSGGKVNRRLVDFCRQYTTGMAYLKARDEAKQSSSVPRKTKEVPITHFYSSVKRQTAPPDDATVAAITNGINKINSPTKSLLPPGKRLREEEDGLTEQEIQKQLLSEHDSEETPVEEKNPALARVPTDEDSSTAASPKSPKRPKRLIDFYPSEDAG